MSRIWMDIQSYQSCTIPKQHLCHIPVNKSAPLEGGSDRAMRIASHTWALGIAGIMLGGNTRKGPLAHSKCTNTNTRTFILKSACITSTVLLANDMSY